MLKPMAPIKGEITDECREQDKRHQQQRLSKPIEAMTTLRKVDADERWDADGAKYLLGYNNAQCNAKKTDRPEECAAHPRKKRAVEVEQEFEHCANRRADY